MYESRKESQLRLYKLWHFQLGLLGVISPHDPGLLGKLVSVGKWYLFLKRYLFFGGGGWGRRDNGFMRLCGVGHILCKRPLVKTLYSHLRALFRCSITLSESFGSCPVSLMLSHVSLWRLTAACLAWESAVSSYFLLFHQTSCSVAAFRFGGLWHLFKKY